MVTYRKRHAHWTETHRVVQGRDGAEVKVVTCCCERPAARARECADARGIKSLCRCDCHAPARKEAP